jgi:hypothetical protein
MSAMMPIISGFLKYVWFFFGAIIFDSDWIYYCVVAVLRRRCIICWINLGLSP